MLFALILIPVLISIFLVIIPYWKIYSKAGQPGWASLIPIYNLYILTKMAGKPGSWTILMIIPGLGMIWYIWTWNLIIHRFGKDTGFTVGFFLLNIVFLPILGYGDAQYDGGASDAMNDVLDDGAAAESGDGAGDA